MRFAVLAGTGPAPATAQGGADSVTCVPLRIKRKNVEKCFASLSASAIDCAREFLLINVKLSSAGAAL